MWRSFDFTLIWPFLIGGLAGVPLGTMLVAHADPHTFKLAFGVFLLIFPALYLQRAPVAFSIRRQAGGHGYRICRRHHGGPRRPVRPASDPVGQRARLGQGRAARRVPGLQLDYPFAALCLQIGSGLVKADVIRLAFLTLPGTVLGAWFGKRVYHALSDRNFRDIVLGLLFLSGVALVGAH